MEWNGKELEISPGTVIHFQFGTDDRKEETSWKLIAVAWSTLRHRLVPSFLFRGSLNWWSVVSLHHNQLGEDT